MNARRLFLCNTPYHVIVAILLANQLREQGDIFDAFVSDCFTGAEGLCKRLRERGPFDSVHYVKLYDALHPSGVSELLRKAGSVIFLGAYIREILGNEAFSTLAYDEIYYNDDHWFLYGLCAVCAQRNPNVRVFRFEEGYSSYLTRFGAPRAKAVFHVRSKLTRDATFQQRLGGRYFFYPELVQFQPDVPLLRIERTISESVRRAVAAVFPVRHWAEELNGKWIVFEESFFQDSGYQEDMRLFQRFFDYAGPENVVIKMHPRSRTMRFRDSGVRVLESEGIPWEAMLILCGFQNIKLLALASGSVINARLLLGNAMDSYLLYQCVEPATPLWNADFQNFLAKLSAIEGSHLWIPETEEAFYHILEKTGSDLS